MLAKIIENLKWQDEQAAITKKLLLYPAIVTVTVIGVLFFLMLYVVPQLIAFLATMGQELPLQTRALIATSGFLAEYWYLVLFAARRSSPAACVRLQHQPSVRRTHR